MNKFNKLFVDKKTRVKLISIRGWWLVLKIEPDREWIEIQGHYGLYHRGLIERFTNSPDDSTGE
jgi:hypothetical protein